MFLGAGAVVVAAAIGVGVALTRDSSSTDDYWYMAEDVTPRSLTCGAPSDPRAQLALTDASVQRNDATGVYLSAEVSGLQQFRLMEQREVDLSRAGRPGPMHGAVIGFNLQYGSSDAEGLAATAIVADTSDIRVEIRDRARPAFSYEGESKWTVHEGNWEDKYEVAANVSSNGNVVTFRIPPEAMAGYPAGKRPIVTASLGEFLATGSVPAYDSTQECREPAANSGGSVAPAKSPGSAESAGDSRQEARKVDQLNELLQSHNLDTNIAVNTENGRGFGTAFMDAQGIPEQTCDFLRVGGEHNSFGYALDAFGNRTGFAMSQADSQQWLVDMLTVYCPDNLSTVPGRTPAASTAHSAWSGPTTVAVSPSPEFPSSMPKWRLESSWDGTTRAFTGRTWSPSPGPNHTAFPATQNGCDSARFLVRWRAVAEGSMVEATAMRGGQTPGQTVIGQAGWMDLNACEVPSFRLQSRNDGSTLTDVTFSVQTWVPAP
ncbi:hypothetical protein [Prescottella equi]|uniref:hypothetical protein n=1 Tax=Rhodococcus hoagii TaxID=43767 RepID=UPI003B7CE7AB